jgi:hypothetical protein
MLWVYLLLSAVHKATWKKSKQTVTMQYAGFAGKVPTSSILSGLGAMFMVAGLFTSVSYYSGNQPTDSLVVVVCDDFYPSCAANRPGTQTRDWQKAEAKYRKKHNIMA